MKNVNNFSEYIEEHGIYKLPDEVVVPTGTVQLEFRDGKTGTLKDLIRVPNMFVTAGKESLAAALRGRTEENQGIITYCAVGTGVTAPSLSDTQLEAEIARKLISVRESAGNIATFRTFYTTSEANGTLREAGLFGDLATAIANSGTLFARTAINRVKSPSDTLTLGWAVTIG